MAQPIDSSVFIANECGQTVKQIGPDLNHS
jgi:hypothetical protein